MLKIKVGKVTLAKWACPICGEENLTGFDNLECQCGRSFEPSGKEKVRVIPVSSRRKPVSRKKAKQLAEEQGGRCFWCGNEFGEYIVKQGIVRRLEVVVDHLVPWAYSLNHGQENFVAACQICNGWKSSLVFASEEDCRGFLLRKWTRWESSGLIEKLEDTVCQEGVYV